MVSVKGIPIYPGVVGGKVLKIRANQKINIPKININENEVDIELERFKKAINGCIYYLDETRKSASNSLNKEDLEILEIQYLMYKDSELIKRVHRGLKEKLKNVEVIFDEIYQELFDKFSNMKNPYFNDRAKDIKEIHQNVLKRLLLNSKSENDLFLVLNTLKENIILVAKNIDITDLIKLDKSKILGIVLEYGGVTSHIAILTKAFEIPSIFGVDISKIKNKELVVLDSEKGKVIKNIQKTKSREYDQIFISEKDKKREVNTCKNKPSTTLDGCNINLDSNIGMVEEVELVNSNCSTGVGLFRTEFLFLSRKTIPDEDEQTEYYSNILSKMKGNKVTIRTVDIGGDKVNENIFTYIGKEHNPVLGLRGIRLCLHYEEIFRTQIRALLKASIFGNLHIMFPMISHLKQLLRAKEILNEEKNKLLLKGIKIKEDIPVGIMVEVPSVAVSVDIFAKHADFFSIGANDLIQYTLAVDRNNKNISDLYEQFNPSILRLIKNVVDVANQKNIPVSICGELAGDYKMTVFLIGIGLKTLSMSPFQIPNIRYLIRNLSLGNCREIANGMLKLDTEQEILDFVKNYRIEKYPAIFS